ncbi:Gldg family protein [bacterium]|nr:Gldg family protein [bacterium]
MEKKKFDLNSTIGLIMIIGIIVVLNLIALKLFSRLDLTENRIYSLSGVSKDLMRSLDDKVVVKAYFTDNIPAPYNNNMRYLKDKLDEYRAYAGGKLDYEFLDPASDAELEAEARKYRIPPMQVNTIENDQMTLKMVYMGVVFMYENKTEVMPVVQDIKGLEYDITSIIKKLTATETPQIGYLTGHGEPDLTTEIRNFQSVLAGQYSVVPVNLQDQAEVPPGIKTLFVLAPREPFSDNEKYKIDQFLIGGGMLALFIDKVEANLQQQQAITLDLNIDDLLLNYGVAINNDLVTDKKCGQINIQRRQGFFNISNRVEYPFIPMTDNFNRDNIIVKDLENVTFFFVSSLDSTQAAQRGYEFIPLIRTSENAGIEYEPFNITPSMEMFGGTDERSYDYQNIPVAAAIKGKFKSRYTSPPDMLMDYARPHLLECQDTASIVVVGDGDFIKDGNISNKENLSFVLNVIDWLTQEEGLITIRSREVTARPLKEVSNAAKNWIKYLNILLAPVVIALIGLVRWQMRRKRQKEDFGI